MADLRAIVEAAGFSDVRTVLRSGNVVFAGPARAPEAVRQALERGLEERLGMSIEVVVRTLPELEAVVADNPFPEHAADGTYLHVMLFASPLEPERRERIAAEVFEPDVVRTAAREVYAWYANGLSGSTTADRLGRLLAGLVTDRNWNTLGKVLAAAHEVRSRVPEEQEAPAADLVDGRSVGAAGHARQCGGEVVDVVDGREAGGPLGSSTVEHLAHGEEHLTGRCLYPHLEARPPAE